MAADIAIKGTADIEVIKHRIYEVRGMQVMLDRDLAELYGVETKVLNQAVKRNIERFPEDFMFQLNRKDVFFLKSQQTTVKECNVDLRSQFVTLYRQTEDPHPMLKNTTRRYNAFRKIQRKNIARGNRVRQVVY